MQKQTAPLRGLVRKVHGKKETDSQTSLGGCPPGMASWAHPGRQEACVGGLHMEATFAAARRETKSKRSMRGDSCPEHQWEKMQLDPLKGKKQKGKGRSCRNEQVALQFCLKCQHSVLVVGKKSNPRKKVELRATILVCCKGSTFHHFSRIVGNWYERRQWQQRMQGNSGEIPEFIDEKPHQDHIKSHKIIKNHLNTSIPGFNHRLLTYLGDLWDVIHMVFIDVFPFRTYWCKIRF